MLELNFIFLASFSSLFELANLDYINSGKIKLNMEFVREFLLYGAILLALIKLFLKQNGCIIGCRGFKIVKWLIYKKTRLNKKKIAQLKKKGLII